MRRLGRRILALCMVLTGALAGLGPLTPASVGAATPCTLHGATGRNAASSLYAINPATGAATQGPVTAPGVALTGLAVHPHTGVLYGSTSTNSPASPGNLVTVNKTTGAVTVIGPFGLGGDTLADITFDAFGRLFGADSGAGDLYTVNLATGAATLVGITPIVPFGGFGIAFAPSAPGTASGRLFLAPESELGNLYTLNPSTGEVTSTTALTGGTMNQDTIAALGVHPNGMLYGIALRDPALGNTARLVTINPTTGAISTLGQSVNSLGALAWDCRTGVNGQGAVPAPAGASFRFDVQQLPGGPVTGYLTYTAPGISLRTSSFANLTISGNTATFDGRWNGPGCANGGQSCTFTATAVDNGEPGAGADAFTIALSAGGPQGGVVTGGYARIR